MTRHATTVLPSGLRVVTVTAHAPVVHVELFVRAGSRLDAPEDEGLSHFVEHMLHRGTARYRTSRNLATAAERLGSSINASSGRLDTSYAMTVLPANVPAAVDLIAEMVQRPRFDDLELERALVIEELAEDYDDRDVLINIDDLVRQAMFPKHPASHTVLGPPSHVRTFTLDDVRRHWRANYHPSNMVLVVVGAVDHCDACRSAQVFVGPVSRRGTSSSLRGEPYGRDEPEVLFVDDGSAHVDVTVAFRARPRRLMHDWVGQVALVQCLDGGMSGPLHHTIADQQGIAYSVGADVESHVDTGVFEITAEVQPHNTGRLVETALSIAKHAHDAITEEAVERGRAAINLQLAGAVDGPVIANAYAMHYLYGDPSPEETAKAFGDWWGASAARWAADMVLDRENLVVVCVGDVPRGQRDRVRRAVASW